MLDRKWDTIKTRWGAVRIKHGMFNGVTIKSKPEYDDCLRIARENNISINDIYKEISTLINVEGK